VNLVGDGGRQFGDAARLAEFCGRHLPSPALGVPGDALEFAQGGKVAAADAAVLESRVIDSFDGRALRLLAFTDALKLLRLRLSAEPFSLGVRGALALDERAVVAFKVGDRVLQPQILKLPTAYGQFAVELCFPALKRRELVAELSQGREPLLPLLLLREFRLTLARGVNLRLDLLLERLARPIRRLPATLQRVGDEVLQGGERG